MENNKAQEYIQTLLGVLNGTSTEEDTRKKMDELKNA